MLPLRTDKNAKVTKEQNMVVKSALVFVNELTNYSNIRRDIAILFLRSTYQNRIL